jgi:putative two-component system response regulator
VNVETTILIADDEAPLRGLIEALLSTEGYRLEFAENGRQALHMAETITPDLILLDVMMPELNGYEVCRELRDNERLCDIPIIMITGLGDRSSRLAGIEAGADDFVSKPFDAVELRARIRTITRLNRYRKLQDAYAELMCTYDATLEGWIKFLDLRDKETEGHTLRVTEMTVRLAMAMGINGSKLVDIRRGSLLHDIGKIGIPDAVLHKPGPLNQEERAIIETHPQLAYDMLHPIPFLRPALAIPYAHHEKWDGTGYPRKLKGEDIPLEARLFAVVDIWDALSSDRPYRSAWTRDRVRGYLDDIAGSHLDPYVVEAFLRLEEEMFCSQLKRQAVVRV